MGISVHTAEMEMATTPYYVEASRPGLNYRYSLYRNAYQLSAKCNLVFTFLPTRYSLFTNVLSQGWRRTRRPYMVCAHLGGSLARLASTYLHTQLIYRHPGPAHGPASCGCDCPTECSARVLLLASHDSLPQTPTRHRSNTQLAHGETHQRSSSPTT